MLQAPSLSGQAPPPVHEVYAIRYGTLPRFPVAALVAGADTARRMDIALMIWLIRDQSGRAVLLDAGFYRDRFMTRWKPADYQRPSTALARVGLRPEEVTDVIISHVHWDHLDGADLFPKARFWIQRDEYEHYVDSAGRPRASTIDSADARMLADLSRAGRVELIAGDSVEVLPGIRVYTGGKHTFASQYAAVTTSEGTVVLASDNLYLYENLERGRPIAQTLDSVSNLAAQARMLRLAGDPARIVPGHDPSVFTRHPLPGDGVARIAAPCTPGCAPSRTWELSAPRQAALNRVLDDAVASHQVPGVVALVTTADRVVHVHAAGTMDEAGAVPMPPDAIFDIASMTKPITSLGVMMLVEEGKIGLDDPASRYLPELAGREVLVKVDSAAGTVETRPAKREVTIRDLLRHTSGIGYSIFDPDLHAIEKYTRTPFREYPLLHDPGTRWTYGMGTAQLGWIIEEVTGLPLMDFFRTRIFGPLGMAETSFSLSSAKAHRLATTFRRVNGHLRAVQRPDSIQSAGQGDGDLLSTAADYAKFIQLMLGRGQRGDVRLLSEASVAEMTRNQLDGLTVVEQPAPIPSLSAPFPLGAGRDGFGLGFQIASNGPDGRPDGSLSWAGLYNTHFWIDPRNGIGVVLLFQVLPFYDPQVIAVLRAVERAVYLTPGSE
jgi:methyl acetate hydrolase